MVLLIIFLVFLSVARSDLHISAQAPMDDVNDIEQGIKGQRKTKDDLAAYYWDKLTGKQSVVTNAEEQLQVEKAIKGHIDRRRKRAFLTGWVLRQWKRILSNAEQVDVNAYRKLYQKNGDYNMALADFKSFNPAHVKDDWGIKRGGVGDWFVQVNYGIPDSPVLLVEGPGGKRRTIKYIQQKGPSNN